MAPDSMKPGSMKIALRAVVPNSWQIARIFVLGLILMAVGLNCSTCQAQEGGQAQEGTKQDVPEAQDAQADDNANVQEGNVPAANADAPRINVKVVPDLKFFAGSAPYVFSLEKSFSETSFAKEGQKATYKVVLNRKDKVAELVLANGDSVTVTPQKLGKTEVIIEATYEKGARVLSKFYVSVHEANYWQLFLTVIGGLGIFLLGMKNMSEGLQAVAGNSLRRLIGAVTSNRFIGVGVGTFVTMVVQSSSITTVIVVGFVNIGYMTLSQAIGVIMGANIGTTITGWILVLKIGKYGLPLVGLGAFVYLFMKKDRLRYVAMAVMGLGMVFLGLELMKDGFSIIKDLPVFLEWFERFSADSWFGVLKCAAVGCILTFIVQSSSATLGITIGLAQIGVIPFETAAALVMGENVGTTITAWLASRGASTNAKRAAYFHMIFNLIGVFWITAIFGYYLELIRFIIGGNVNAAINVDNVTKAISTTHSIFNIVNMLMFLPFVPFFTYLLERILPAKGDASEEPHLTGLDMRMLETPSIAVEEAKSEVRRMGKGCQKMMAWVEELLQQDQLDDHLVQSTLNEESQLDSIQHEVVEFLSKLLSANVPHDITEEVRGLFRITDEYESISDCIATVLKSHRKLAKRGLKLPDEERENIQKLHAMVAIYLESVNQYYQEGQVDIEQSKKEADAITAFVKQLEKSALDKPVEDRLGPRLAAGYNRQSTAYRRVRDHALNVAQTIGGQK